MGVITRVAGTGGPATVAQLGGPQGVAVTADGGFLIADANNNEVRKVSAAGVITRVAGTGGGGAAGMTALPPSLSSMVRPRWRDR